MDDSRIVFVIGVGRSGTTAMAELLNTHEEICIGIERYKFKFVRRGEFEGDEFEPGRFFDFRPTDTNLLPDAEERWRVLYDRLRDKFPRARVRGDKIPHLFERFEACAAAFPQAKWIYMLRDIDGVATSWNGRAHNPEDKWPRGNDYRRAVEVWNRANALIRDLPEDGRVHVVSYQAFFGGAPGTRRALLDFLELEPTPAFRSQARAASQKYQRLQDKVRVVLEGQPAHLAATADMASYHALVERSDRSLAAQRSAAATA